MTLERTKRAVKPIPLAARVTAGRTRPLNEEPPNTANQCRFTAKITSRIRPSQKLGIDSRMSENPIATVSVTELRLSAATTPMRLPKKSDSASPAAVSLSVAGRFSRISVETGCCWPYE